MYLEPLKHKLLSLLGKSSSGPRAVAETVWEIHPAERQEVPEAMYNASDLERITGCWEGTTIAREVEKLNAGVREHVSTTAFRLRHVDLVDGYLFCGAWKDRLLPLKAPLFAARPEIQIAHGSLACTYMGSYFFGHWVTDDLTLYLVAEQTGDPFIVERKPYLHEPAYRELLAIPRNALSRVHFDELIVFQDFGQNEHKRKRYELLRSRLRSAVTPRGARRVMLRRGSTGKHRSIVNSAELEAFLSTQGFTIVDPENLTPAEIAAETIGASIVVGVEGSHMLHAVLAVGEGGALCCIQPPWRFNSVIRDYTDCLRLHYATVVGHEAEGGFRVDLEDIRRILTKIEAVAPA